MIMTASYRLHRPDHTQGYRNHYPLASISSMSVDRNPAMTFMALGSLAFTAISNNNFSHFEFQSRAPKILPKTIDLTSPSCPCNTAKHSNSPWSSPPPLWLFRRGLALADRPRQKALPQPTGLVPAAAHQQAPCGVPRQALDFVLVSFQLRYRFEAIAFHGRVYVIIVQIDAAAINIVVVVS